MQVQAINNTNRNYNTSFGARLELSGDIKNLPTKYLTRFESAAKNIGRESDLISLKIGPVMQKVEMFRDTKINSIKSIDYYRFNEISSIIGGKEKEDIVISKEGTDFSNLSRQIVKYINKLGQ